MIRCDVYEFLSFLTNLNLEEDLLIPAILVNRMDSLLRAEGVLCDFSKQAFERAAYEYPDRFDVDDMVIRIKVQPRNCKKFVYFNSKRQVVSKIEEKWKVVKEY